MAQKIEITLTYDDERVEAMEFYLKKENSTVQKKMEVVLGLTRSPLTRTSKWRCGPVERPVEPDMATTVPVSTALPTDTISWEQWPYSVVSPLPWSIMT